MTTVLFDVSNTPYPLSAVLPPIGAALVLVLVLALKYSSLSRLKIALLVFVGTIFTLPAFTRLLSEQGLRAATPFELTGVVSVVERQTVRVDDRGNRLDGDNVGWRVSKINKEDLYRTRDTSRSPPVVDEPKTEVGWRVPSNGTQPVTREIQTVTFGEWTIEIDPSKGRCYTEFDQILPGDSLVVGMVWECIAYVERQR